MSLKRYHEKRNFARTLEPRGDEPAAQRTTPPRFVVQKHQASRLHYDLRLELGGVLVSWAVPKGPSLDPKHKRLAIHVEDHPLAYADFEGVIPAGDYGGGTVMLWDRGAWTDRTPGGAQRGLERGRLKFELHGEKLKGIWTLVQRGEQANHWLLIKHDDAHARPTKEADVLGADRSVKTGRDLEQIAADRDATWSGSHDPSASNRAPDPASAKGARQRPQPKQPRPMLATAASVAPEGEDWLHEVKLDGYRLLALIDAGRVRLLTRRGLDWTDRFPAVAAAVQALPVKQAVLDGEVVVLGPRGLSDFQALQNALKDPGRGHPVLLAFDLLHLDGWDLTAAPLAERKRLLHDLLTQAGSVRDGALRVCEYLRGPGPVILQKACDLSAEGIVSKRLDSRYQPGQRSADWRKVRCLKVEALPIVGFTDPQSGRAGLGALVLAARRDDQQLIYRGRVGTGFDQRTLEALRQRLDALEQDQPPQALQNVPALARRGVHWVTPRLTAEVAYAEQTQDGILRHATYRGLVEDREVDRVPPAPRTSTRRSRGTLQVAGVRVTSPDKVLYPDVGLTKLDLVRYYEQVAHYALPELKDRPLSLLRCPDGLAGGCFFQKHHPDPLPEGLDRVAIEHDDGPKQYAVVRSAAGLIALAQLGTLELHPWGARADRPDRPDRMVLDLDPGADVPWPRVVETAHALHNLLEHLGLQSVVRTTGGKGLHVVVPLERRHEWKQVKRFAHAVARALEKAAPKHYTTSNSKATRRGRIYLDYLRNSRGATAIATLSARARPGAPVAMPLRWDELRDAVDPASFTIATAATLLAQRAQAPWPELSSIRQRLTQAMHRKLGLQRA